MNVSRMISHLLPLLLLGSNKCFLFYYISKRYSHYISIGGYGCKSNLFALAESGGFAGPIFPLLIFIKKWRTQHIVVRHFSCFKISRYIQKENDEFKCYVDYIKI